MKHPVKHALPVMLSACLLAGCGAATSVEATQSEPTGSPAPASGGSVTIAIDSVFTGFDPNVVSMAQDARVMRQVFDMLVDTNADGDIVPWLATSWEISDDELQYDFELRQDVSFHDGTPFNAEAVCFNLDRIKDPATGSASAISLIGPYESCAATDEFHARIRMATPFSPFMRHLVSPYLGFNSPTAVLNSDAGDYVFQPVGSGPFIITSATPGVGAELVRNPDYAWPSSAAQHTGTALLEAITVKLVPDPTVRMGSVRGDTVQIASAVPETDAATIAADPDLAYISAEQAGTTFQLHLNSERTPFDDVAVRKAAAAALDIESTLAALYVGAGTRAWSPITPTTAAYDPTVEGIQTYDPDEAARLLDEAGWLMGGDGVRVKDGQRLEITYGEVTPNREKRQDFARFFEANLEDIGFDVNLIFEQNANSLTRSKTGDYDILGFSLGSADPYVLARIYDASYIPGEGNSGKNYSRVDEPEIQANLAAGQETTDVSAREAAYSAVQHAVVEDVRSIPIYVPVYTLAVNGVAGIRFDLQGYPIYYDAFLADFDA